MTFEESICVRTTTVEELYQQGKISMNERGIEILELGRAMKWV